MEPLSFVLGGAAVKWIVRLWTGETVFEGAEGDIVDAFSNRLSSGREKRALRRDLEALADKIAERLEPFISAEIRGIDEGELAAATLAAQTSLEVIGAMDPAVITSVDMNAALLAELVRKGDPDAIEREHLGEAGAQLYDTLIAECASYIVSIAQKLPGYATAEAAELLGRSSKLEKLTNQILEGLPHSSVPAEWGPGSEDQRFENKYKRAVSEFSDKLQLYGVTSSTAKTPYPLSVAYISLSVDAGPSKGTGRATTSADPNEEWPDESNHFGEEGTLRIDALLEGSDYVLLAGNAGSGKTTLVQWLAISTIRELASSDPARSWLGRIPFVVPLRRYVNNSFPSPEGFVSTIAPNLAGAMPNGWVHRVLASGRGMLLIDGLDEVPRERRDEVREWVLSLIRDFPTSKALVTSRTTAVTKSWRAAGEFQEATLLPMDFSDIRSFIHHWHSAAATTVHKTRQEEVLSAANSLLTEVRDKPAIRSLCTSPLLCALICALHLDSGASLPNNRMDVYKTALEMLVLRRDNDRNVDTLGELELGYQEREILLRSFALWMHENGASDATREDYSQKIEQRLKALYKVKSKPATVSSYLLERSGVLREPIPGRVDFVHRTFLEYLAAAAIVDDNSIERLVLQGHEDHWREVIVMAAGHANSEQRAKLLLGLLARGEKDEEHRPRLYMLAVACMETSPELSASIVQRLESALSDVLPPGNMTEAAAVASAGTLAISMLRSSSGQGAVVAAACVRALGLIGGEDALAALATYGTDSRVTVTRQLIRAWSGFDAERYAEDVLRESPLDNGALILKDPDQLSALPRLKHAKRVFLDAPGALPNSLAIPADHPGLYRVDLSRTPWLTSLRQLPTMPSLQALTLQRSLLVDLDGIDRYSSLSQFDAQGSGSLRDASALAHLRHLKQLELSATSVSLLDFFTSDHELKTFRMIGATELSAIRHPIPARNVTLAYMPSVRDISGLGISDKIIGLQLYGININDLTLELPPSLEQLSLGDEIFRKLDSISGAPFLQSLYFAGQPSSNFLDWVAGHRSLSSVTWNRYLSNPDDQALESAIEQIFSNAQMSELTLWTSETLPVIPGLELSVAMSRGKYSRST